MSDFGREETLDLHWPVTVGAVSASRFGHKAHVYINQDRGHNGTRIEGVRVTLPDLPKLIAALQTRLPIVDALASLDAKTVDEDTFLEQLRNVLCHAFNIASFAEPNGAGQIKDALDAAIRKVDARLGRGPVERIADLDDKRSR